MSAPLTFEWLGDAFAPVGRARTDCDARFVVGMRYVFEQVEDEASSKTRAHFFASLKDMWSTLPERLTDRFPSPAHLRKWALVEAGFSEDRHVACGTKAEAQRWARNLMSLPGFEFCVIVPRDTVVLIRRPKSQSARHMKKAEFQDSKDAVFREIDKLLETPEGDVERNAGMAA